MADEITVEFGLGMTVETDRVVEIGDPLTRHQSRSHCSRANGTAAQPGNRRACRKTKWPDQLSPIKTASRLKPLSLWVAQAQRDWCRCLTGHDATHQVRASSAIKKRIENLERRIKFPIAQRRLQRRSLLRWHQQS